MAIRQITIVGTGLIGGSLALALKKHGFRGRVVGCDRGEVLAKARERGAIDAGSEEIAQAVAGSDVVVLARPVLGIIELIEKLGPTLPKETLLTDVGGTKVEIVARAKTVFGEDAAQRFLPGHPMAGREHGGIEYADGDVFRDAVWLFLPLDGQLPQSGIAGEYVRLIESIGTRVIVIDPERHDKLCGWISHLPQMIATALGATLQDEFGNDPELHAIGGRALREMTRISSSPYSMWRDVAITNVKNLSDALWHLEQRLAHIRENLKTAELRAEFERGNKFRIG